MNEDIIVKEWKTLKIELRDNIKELIENNSEHKETLKFMLYMLESPQTKFLKARLYDNKDT